MSTPPNMEQSLITFGEAVRPLAASTRGRMRQPQTQTVEVADILHFISRHMRVLQNEADSICDEVDLISKGRFDFDADRTVRRMNVHVGRLLTSYDAIRRANPGEADSRGWFLLRELYSDVLHQIQNWFDDVVEMVNDPVSGLEKRGISSEENLSIRLDLSLSLPKANSLNRWTARRAAELKADSRVQHVSILGGLATHFSLSSLFGNDK